jgi:hypothetical protein
VRPHQHRGKLVEHRRGRMQDDLAGLDRRGQRRDARVAEDEPVEPHVGIEDRAHRRPYNSAARARPFDEDRPAC